MLAMAVDSETCTRWALVTLLVALLSACALRAQAPDTVADSRDECVILLHGLVRTSASMNRLEEFIAAAGYTVENYSYPSRTKTIEELATEVVPAAAQSCRERGSERVNFVTHSMGGILVRYYLEQQPIPDLQRVVMISPPNQGSELVELWSNVPGYRRLNGPAGYQLGTGANSLPRRLGLANFEVGVIAGTNTTNVLFSLMIPGADDGKVSVDSARLDGMADFLAVPEAHSLIMRDPAVMQHVVNFLSHGRFERDDTG